MAFPPEYQSRPPSRTPSTRPSSQDLPRPHDSVPTSTVASTDRPDLYIGAAQRMITLETRLPPLLPLWTTPSGSPSALAVLQTYGSPSYSDRPSPISLPSKAKRFIRGPSRRAPPNTPASSDRNDDGNEGIEVEDQSRDSVDSSRVEYWAERQSFKSSDRAERHCHSSASSPSSSRASTPCPTSPISAGSVLDIRWEGGEGKGVGEGAEEPSVGSSGNIRSPSQPKDPEAYTSDLNRTLEGIGAELGSDVSLGYEIRNFRWDRW